MPPTSPSACWAKSTDSRRRWIFLSGVVVLLLAAVAFVPLKWVRVKVLPFDNKSEFQVIIAMLDATGGCGLREPRNPCSPFGCDDAPGRSQDGSFRKGCTARRSFGRVAPPAEASWSVQSRNRLGVCLSDNEGQATAVTRTLWR